MDKMKIIFIPGGVFCLWIGISALREVIRTCWEGYVSPPLNLSDLFIWLFYTISSFLPVVLMVWKLDKKWWQQFILGGTEFVVIAYFVYEVIEIFSHGH